MFSMLNSAEHKIYPAQIPTIVSMINTTSKRFFIVRYFSLNRRLKFHAQLS